MKPWLKTPKTNLKKKNSRQIPRHCNRKAYNNRSCTSKLFLSFSQPNLILISVICINYNSYAKCNEKNKQNMMIINNHDITIVGACDTLSLRITHTHRSNWRTQARTRLERELNESRPHSVGWFFSWEWCVGNVFFTHKHPATTNWFYRLLSLLQKFNGKKTTIFDRVNNRIEQISMQLR